MPRMPLSPIQRWRYPNGNKARGWGGHSQHLPRPRGCHSAGARAGGQGAGKLEEGRREETREGTGMARTARRGRNRTAVWGRMSPGPPAPSEVYGGVELSQDPAPRAPLWGRGPHIIAQLPLHLYFSPLITHTSLDPTLLSPLAPLLPRRAFIPGSATDSRGGLGHVTQTAAHRERISSRREAVRGQLHAASLTHLLPSTRSTRLCAEIVPSSPISAVCCSPSSASSSSAPQLYGGTMSPPSPSLLPLHSCSQPLAACGPVPN